MKKKWLIVIILLVLSCISSYMSSIQPILFQKIIDEGMLKRNVEKIFIFLIIIISLSIGNSMIKIFNNMSINKIGLVVSKQLKESVIRKVFRSPLNFFDNISTGELEQRIKEVDAISSVFNPQLLNIVVSFLTSLVSIIHVMRINSKLFIIYIIAFTLLAILSFMFSTKYKRIMVELVELNTRYSQIVNESIVSINEIKTNNLIISKENRLLEINEQIFNKTKKQNTTFAISNEILVTINLLVTCGITLLFAILWGKEETSLGQYIEVTHYTALILAPAQMLPSCLSVLFPVRILLRRLKFFDNIGVQDNKGIPIEKIDSLEFKNVIFSYDKENVINSLCFYIRKDDKILVSGKNGSGKTTIVKLLLRLYDNFEGEILVNNNGIKEYKLSDIRDRIGVVFQESFLFEGTLGENLICGNRTIKEDIDRVIGLTGLYDVFKVDNENIEELLSFPIVEGGKNISGGQKRMISIARALIKNPDVLILDEPTTYLDFESKTFLIDFVRNLKNIMLIVISHDNELQDVIENELCLESR